LGSLTFIPPFSPGAAVGPYSIPHETERSAQLWNSCYYRTSSIPREPICISFSASTLHGPPSNLLFAEVSTVVE